MRTFTVPVFLGVNADSPEEAVELALSFMEHAVDTGNDDGAYPYCDIGRADEVIEQLEVRS